MVAIERNQYAANSAAKWHHSIIYHGAWRGSNIYRIENIMSVAATACSSGMRVGCILYRRYQA